MKLDIFRQGKKSSENIIRIVNDAIRYAVIDETAKSKFAVGVPRLSGQSYPVGRETV
jgi:hypothetical protein